jgi:hypothetical protein
MFATTLFANITNQPRQPNIDDEEEEKIDDSSLSWHQNLKRLWKTFVANIYLFCFVSYALWTFMGIIFYYYYDGFTLATSYYYAMEAGLSIGFCQPSEIDDWSRLFTIGYDLLGSSVVSGAIGVLAGHLMSTRTTLIRVNHEFGAFSLYDEVGKVTVGSICRFLWYHMKWLFGWYTHRSITIVFIFFLLWIAWGTILVMKTEQYSFITALYWAVTTMATGGLQSPACLYGTEGDTCNIGTLRGGLMGFYMMIGVPLYAITLAQISRFAVDATMEARQQSLLNAPITDADFLFTANILSPQGSTTLVMGEYLLLELMRLGATNQQQIEEIKKKFYKIDCEQKGELEIEDLRKSGVVIPRKLHSIELTKRIRTGSMELLQSVRNSAANLSIISNNSQ